MQHTYDDEGFFQAYAHMPRSRAGLAAAGEWGQLRPLFPQVAGKAVLDLGCGYGWHCQYAVQMGAATVVGIDASQKMLSEARRQNPHPNIQYAVCQLEDYAYPPDTFDLVLSNLVLHYIADLDWIYGRVYSTLKQGGCFLFNMEHPVFTAGVNQDWARNQAGQRLHWPVDNYFYPGPRETRFLGCQVVKRHHTLTQVLNGLLAGGFVLQAVEEVMPPAAWLDDPDMADEMRRPMMLLVKAAKP